MSPFLYLLIMKDLIKKVLKEEIDSKKLGVEVEPSSRVIKSICDAKKFCKAQGPITFGQLKAIVNSAIKERLGKHIGEGSFKATLRLLPWFLPQLAVAGFGAALLRAANKIIKPSLTETQNYKTWWGKTILILMEAVEGDLPLTDPFSRIFFISDGLMNLMDEENKVKFARHIAELASKMPDDEPVPDLFVENELRQWVNKRFLLDPPLEPKKIKEAVVGDRIVCDDCGWAWKIEEGGDDLYMCHQCGHDNTPKKDDPFGLNELAKTFVKESFHETWNPQKDFLSLCVFMKDNGMNITPLPKIKVIKDDEENASRLLGKTAYYNPADKSITLYTLGRHPKDVLRSFAHEMVHHEQNLNGTLGNITTTNTNEDGHLQELEKEAYLKGNIMFRNWEDSIKNV